MGGSAATRGAWWVGALAIVMTSAAQAAPVAALLPLPAEISPAAGVFALEPTTAVYASDPDSQAAARYLIGLLERSRAVRLSLHAGAAPAGTISFARQRGIANEGYRLEIAPQRIRITAASGAGFFYGAITLWQLLPSGTGAAAVPAQVIRDAPAYPWRGLLLDSARHFQSPAFIESMLEWMAWHKLNVLHWHLTDDQGWRLQILKYPRLTEIGAWRTPAAVGGASEVRYGGFYTQSQVRDIVAFAATRHITVVPEIDMPGHAQAAIAAYPELGSRTGPPPSVSNRWGVHSYLFNLEPATFAFLENVLEEVIALFPSRDIHIGGDEASKDQWNSSPAVQARARALGIADPKDLQAYFTQEIGRFLARHGRRLAGWDEILRPGLAKDAIVMSWRGTSGAHAAALAGNDTVLTPWPPLYFDNRQSSLPSEPPGRMQVISLQDVYHFDPQDHALSPTEQRHILGVQANVWTEHIRTEDRLEWMAFPRAIAVAELGWTPPARRSWPDFLDRLVSGLDRYRALGIVFADSAFAIAASLAPVPSGVEVQLSNQAAYGQIRYTLDGTEPTPRSSAYTSPLTAPYGGELRAATFAGEVRASGITRLRLDRAALAHRTSLELDLCSEGIPLLLESSAVGPGRGPLFAIDIMNPCWIYRSVDLTHGARLEAAVGPLPFNFEVGEETKKIRIGDAHSPLGEFEVRIDGCEAAPAVSVPLALPAPGAAEREVPPLLLPERPGRHDICLRFARPALDPLWALDWVQVSP
jgi:hexosaminidase